MVLRVSLRTVEVAMWVHTSSADCSSHISDKIPKAGQNGSIFGIRPCKNTNEDCKAIRKPIRGDYDILIHELLTGLQRTAYTYSIKDTDHDDFPAWSCLIVRHLCKCSEEPRNSPSDDDGFVMSQNGREDSC